MSRAEYVSCPRCRHTEVEEVALVTKLQLHDETMAAQGDEDKVFETCAELFECVQCGTRFLIPELPFKPRVRVEAPELDIDKRLNGGKPLRPSAVVERRIVANLIAHLEQAGFKLHSVYDGEELTPVDTAKEAMELIFNLDEASLRFWKPGTTKSVKSWRRGEWGPDEHPVTERGKNEDALWDDPWHGVVLTVGEGGDIISDWNFFSDDRDGFSAAMDAFRVEAYY